MFFTLSKLIYFVITPSNFLILVALIGCGLMLIRRARQIGQGLILVSATGLFVAGFSPVSAWISLPLEERFPAFVADEGPITGIIVLGGGVEAQATNARRQIVVNNAGEREIAMADLARRYPDARLLFAGGSGNLEDGSIAEAAVIGRYADSLGLPRTRLILEDRSRNTHENATFAAILAKPKDGERWLLVTSSWHMPRAIGCFRKAGFAVTAYPVDYRTGGWADAGRFNAFASDGLLLLDLVVKEWIGLVAYRIAGYSDDWMPAPQPRPESGNPSR